MAATAAFDRVCGDLEAASVFSTLEARGTVRLALKQAGFDPKQVTREQMAAVVRKVLPRELELRGIEGAEALCERLASSVESLEAEDGAKEAPEDVFARLGG